MTRIDEPAFRLGYTKTKSPDVDREDDRVGTPSQNGFPRLRKRCNYRLTRPSVLSSRHAFDRTPRSVKKDGSVSLGLRGLAAYQTALDVLGCLCVVTCLSMLA